MLHIGLLLLTNLSNPIGVVTVSKGDVEVLQPTVQMFQKADSGLLLHADDAIETAETAWVEVMMTSGITIRMAASSELKINKDFILLGNGRIWIQSMAQVGSSAQELRVWGGRLKISPGSTLVAERIKDRGVNITMVRGHALVAMKNPAYPKTKVSEGYSFWLRPSVVGPGPQKSSRAIWTILEHESRKILGDRIGFEKYLLDWVRETKPDFVVPSSVWEMPKMNSNLRGESGTLFDALLESAIRPAPFRESEVPAKGPNVRVEVNFEGS